MRVGRRPAGIGSGADTRAVDGGHADAERALGGCRRFLVFGGEAPLGTFDAVESYDPRRNRWAPVRPMPTARHGLGSVTVDGRVYVIAGGTRPGGSASGHNEIFSRSP